MEISISNPRLRAAIYSAFDGRCFYTNRIVPETDMAIDHLMPKHLGGKDEIENYVLTSRRLNLKKSANIDPDRIDQMLFIVKSAYAPKVYRLLKIANLNRIKTRKRNRDVQVGLNRYITKKDGDCKINPCPFCGATPEKSAEIGYPGSPEGGWSDYFWIHCCNDDCKQKPETAQYGPNEFSPIWYWNNGIFLNNDIKKVRLDMPEYMKDFDKKMNKKIDLCSMMTLDKGAYIRRWLEFFEAPQDVIVTLLPTLLTFRKDKLLNAFCFIKANFAPLDLGGGFKWVAALKDYLNDTSQLLIIKKYMRESRWCD